MNYSYTSRPASITTSTTETVVTWTRNKEPRVDRVMSQDPRDIITFYVENTGATDINAQVYGLMNTTDDALTQGVPLFASPETVAAGDPGALTFAPGANGYPHYALSLDAASGTPTARCLAVVKSAT